MRPPDLATRLRRARFAAELSRRGTPRGLDRGRVRLDVQRKDRGAASPREARAPRPAAVLLFKPRVDNRYDEVKVVSHEGVNAEAIPVASAAELLARGCAAARRSSGIDEVQFFDDGIVDAAQALADRGRPGHRGRARSGLARPAVRARCPRSWRSPSTSPSSTPSAPAAARRGTRSQRLVAAEGQLFVGGAAEYEARCRACFVPTCETRAASVEPEGLPSTRADVRPDAPTGALARRRGRSVRRRRRAAMHVEDARRSPPLAMQAAQACASFGWPSALSVRAFWHSGPSYLRAPAGGRRAVRRRGRGAGAGPGGGAGRVPGGPGSCAAGGAGCGLRR